MLKQRIATALVLIALFLVALFYIPTVWFLAVVALVVLLASWEWSNMVGLRHIAARFGYVVCSGILLALCSQLVEAPRESQMLFLGSACLWWLIALLWVKGFPGTIPLWGNCWVKAVMGWFVLIPTWLAMSILVSWSGEGLWSSADSGRWTLLIVVLIVVLMDTGGYMAGRMFGRRKLAPQVSPAKTWAGFIGGLTVNGVLLAVVGWLLDADARLWLLLALLIAVTACASVLGDLLESMVKRQRNIKDSGTILPGHGGILDRVDGMTAAFPMFTLLYLLCTENALFT